MANKKITTYQTAVLHARAHRSFRNHLSQRLKTQGMTVMEWALLGLVSQHQKDGVSVTDLAGMLNVKTALASVMVSKQVKAGMVEKISSKRDSRLRQVCLTEEGKARIQQIEAELHKDLDAWFKKNGIEDLDAYLQALSRLADAKP